MRVCVRGSKSEQLVGRCCAHIHNCRTWGPWLAWVRPTSQVLLQYGADMLIKNPRAGTEQSILCSAGSTPLHMAVRGVRAQGPRPVSMRACRGLPVAHVSPRWQWMRAVFSGRVLPTGHAEALAAAPSMASALCAA